jgi:hypothetical protein
MSDGNEDKVIGLMSRCVPLLFDCPIQSQTKECPLASVRELDVMAQVKWLKARTAKELKAVLDHHAKCSKKR